MTNVTFALQDWHKALIQQIPAAVEITSRGRTVSLVPDSLPVEVLAQALEHGLRQKIADSAASALLDAFSAVHDEEAVKTSTSDSRKAWGNEHPEAVADAAQAAMEAAIVNLREHGWTVRQPGIGTLSDIQKTAIGLVRDALKRKGGKAWKAYTSLDKASDKTAHLLAIAEKPDNWVKLEPMARKILAQSGPDLDL